MAQGLMGRIGMLAPPVGKDRRLLHEHLHCLSCGFSSGRMMFCGLSHVQIIFYLFNRKKGSNAFRAQCEAFSLKGRKAWRKEGKSPESPFVPNPERGIRPGMAAGPVRSPFLRPRQLSCRVRHPQKPRDESGDTPGVPPPSKTCPEQVCHAPPNPALRKSHQKEPESPAAARVRDAPGMALR